MTGRLQFDDLTFDADSRQLWMGATEVRLSPKAFELLAFLIERRPDALSKVEIRVRLWPGTFVSDSSLPSLISEIRAAIRDSQRRRDWSEQFTGSDTRSVSTIRRRDRRPRSRVRHRGGG